MSGPNMGTVAVRRTEIEQIMNQHLCGRNFIAPRLLPFTAVGDPSGTIPAIAFTEWLKTYDDRRGADGRYPRASYKMTPLTWSTSERGLEINLDDRKKKIYVGGGSLEVYSAMFEVDALLRAREQRVINLLTNTADWTGSANTASVGASWKTNTTDISADVIAALDGIFQKCGANPINSYITMVISFKMWQYLSQNKALLDRMKYVTFVDGRIPLPQLAAAAGVNEVLVSGMPQNSANEGATASVANFWPDGTVGFYVLAQTGNPEEPCIGRTFAFNGDGGIGPDGVVLESYREEQSRSDILRVRFDIDERVHSLIFGFTLTGAAA